MVIKPINYFGRHGLVEFKQVYNKHLAQTIFTQANLTNDYNSKNYTQYQFDKGWDEWWAGYFVLFDQDQPVAFCSLRYFADTHMRIFDRFFVFPKYRKPGLGDNEYCQIMLPLLLENCENRIPFFSMEFAKRRKVLQNAIDSCNQVLAQGQQFHLLDGLYETAPDSWQNIAIQQPHNSIDLKYRSLDNDLD